MHNKSLQHRSGTSCLHWTVFKSRLCGFAAQKHFTKPQLKNCRLARRYVNIEMSIPKKGSRKIIVGENEFSWLIRQKPTYSQDCLGAEMTVTVELVELSGSILRITFPFSRPDASIKLNSGSVTPSMVEQSIKNAISKGWSPKVSNGVFEYRYAST